MSVDVGDGVSVGVGDGVIVGVEVDVAVGVNVDVAVGVGVRVSLSTWNWATDSCLPLVKAREKVGEPNQIINPNTSSMAAIAPGRRIGRLRIKASDDIDCATRGRGVNGGLDVGIGLRRKRLIAHRIPRRARSEVGFIASARVR